MKPSPVEAASPLVQLDLDHIARLVLRHQLENARDRQHLAALKRVPREILIPVPIPGPCVSAVDGRKEECKAQREGEKLLHRPSIPVAC